MTTAADSRFARQLGRVVWATLVFASAALAVSVGPPLFWHYFIHRSPFRDEWFVGIGLAVVFMLPPATLGFAIATLVARRDAASLSWRMLSRRAAVAAAGTVLLCVGWLFAMQGRMPGLEFEARVRVLAAGAAVLAALVAAAILRRAGPR